MEYENIVILSRWFFSRTLALFCSRSNHQLNSQAFGDDEGKDVVTWMLGRRIASSTQHTRRGGRRNLYMIGWFSIELGAATT